MTPQASRVGVELVMDSGGAVPEVEVDAERVQRAVINLIHNALKFTPAGGRVRVWVEPAGDGVAIHVADNGAGIAPDDQPRVFERFYKADRARSGGGSGLGLAIVKHVAQAHGGSVSLRSAPGEGSDFAILLPAAA
jgi:two-component system phosphate regulon sensor histidine kinase PhoR